MLPTSWVKIDLEAICANADRIQQHTQRPLIAVVKANAYGHGLLEVARALMSHVAMFAVATVEEALTLRGTFSDIPILNLFPVLPDQTSAIIYHRVHQISHTTENLNQLARTAEHLGQLASVHLKIDTGMHRVGFPHENVGEILAGLRQVPWICVEGVSTHLACADELGQDYTEKQLCRFQRVLEACTVAGLDPPWVHVSNSAGVLHWPASHFRAVRPGLLLYGLCPVQGVPLPFEPTPALTWRSRLIQVREIPEGEPIGYGGTYRTERLTRVATVPVGYGDGYPRKLSNRGRVLIRGHSAPILGRVCMDQLMCDVTETPGTRVGDEVVLLGKQGDAEIPAAEIATHAETIHYEILTSISPRVKRIYGIATGTPDTSEREGGM